ncbi:MAG: carbohydrate kinase family protein [Promethearchaeota archaeon]
MNSAHLTAINEKKFDVIVIGSAGIDTNVYLYNEDVDFSVEANFSQNIDYVGQAGGYYSKAFSALGLKVGYIGFVGDDALGQMLKADFQSQHIDISQIRIDPAGTKRSVNIMYKNGQRKNFYDGKGHMNLNVSFDSIRDYLASVKLIHFNLMNWSRSLLKDVKELGKIISCDLQDFVEIGDPYRDDFIKYADYLMLSCVNFPDPNPLLNYIFKINPTAKVLMGRGKEGCIYATKSSFESFSAVDLENLPVIDTNGAGDSLGAGFLVSLLFDEFPINESILRGQIFARYTCGLKASSNLLNKENLEQLYSKMKSNKNKE